MQFLVFVISAVQYIFVCFVLIVIQLSDDTYASLLSVMADIQYLKVTYTKHRSKGDTIHVIFQALV